MFVLDIEVYLEDLRKFIFILFKVKDVIMGYMLKL